LKFQQPPSENYRKYNWDDIISKLKDNPGKWGVVEPEKPISPAPHAVLSTALRIKKGRISGMEPGEYDATVRKNQLYARYIGDDR
jgi:hypothetical protein